MAKSREKQFLSDCLPTCLQNCSVIKTIRARFTFALLQLLNLHFRIKPSTDPAAKQETYRLDEFFFAQLVDTSRHCCRYASIQSLLESEQVE